MSLLSRELTSEEVQGLERLAGSRTEEHRLVERASWVLAASRSTHMCDVVRITGKDKHTIRLWTTRFLEEGLSGLRDRPRSGHPWRFTPDQVALLVHTALTPPEELDQPFGSWTQERLSVFLLERYGLQMSPTRVGELLRQEGLRWRREETWFSESIDPEFLKKRGLLSSYTGLRQRMR